MNIEVFLAKLQFSMHQRSVMYRKLSDFARQGIPIYTTIEKFIFAYTEMSKPNPVLKMLTLGYYNTPSVDYRVTIMNEWQKRMADGSSFSQALDGFVPKNEIMLIQSGEARGDLPGGMEKALFITHSIKRINGAVIGGLSYPFTILLVICGMIYMFATSVIPEMAHILPPENWPEGAPKLLYSISLFVSNFGAIIAVLILVAFVVISNTMNIFSGRLREILDGFPPWSIHKTMQGSIFLITLSSLMSAGVSINSSLIRIRDMAPPYLSDYIDKMLQKLSIGETNGESLNVGIFRDDLAVDIKLMGQVANFESIIAMLGKEAVERDIEKISDSAKILNNLVLVFSGVVIGFIYYAFYTLTSSIGQQ
jgi:type II secretory pathway component PulF